MDSDDGLFPRAAGRTTPNSSGERCRGRRFGGGSVRCIGRGHCGGLGALRARRRERGSGRLLRGHLQDPTRHVGALPGGGSDLSRSFLDHPGRHRHRRVRQRAVRPARCPQRHQLGRAQRARCSSSPQPSRSTPNPCPRAGLNRRAPTTRPTRCTPRLGCSAPTGRRRRRHRRCGVRLQPLGVLCGAGLGAGTVLRGRPRLDPWRARPVCRRGRRGGVGSGADRHAVHLGRRDARRGFDCSGLVQAAYKVADVALPRVAQDQYDETTKIGSGRRPGTGGPRLLRRRAQIPSTTSGSTLVSSAASDVMVDAPLTGADVRAEDLPCDAGCVLWELALRRGHAAGLTAAAVQLTPNAGRRHSCRAPGPG